MLDSILDEAYGAQVLGRGSVASAIARFKSAAADPEFIAAAETAKAAFESANSQGKKCFVSRQNAEFLNLAFASL